MNSLELQLCDIQGRLFELSGRNSYDSEGFIKAFMLSDTEKRLDMKYNRLQWAGEEYLLEEIIDESNFSIPVNNNIYNNETLYWTGYIYRYWHFYTGESSKQIYKQAPAKIMNSSYLMFHTMDPSMAIDDLKEIYIQKRGISS